ncbi:DUF3459 domain-containing protein [Actinosynnema sp. NPDC047251]|nr:DUF3459 domain-containing protein [Saccharothrix espanaensis]
MQAPTTWVLSNHDVRRHATRYGSQARARAAALLMLALPGSAYVYQGEELGLPEVLDLPEDVLQDPVWERSGHTDRGRDGCRVPIPWTVDGPSFGFGDAAPWLPQPSDWGARSVQAQQGDPDSVLELYRAALRIRREHPDLGAGTRVDWLDAPENVLRFRRGTFTCTVNLSAEPVTLPTDGDLLLTSGTCTTAGPTIKVPADTAVWSHQP